MSCSHRKSAIAQDIDAATLIAALFFLMTRYSRDQDNSLVQPILDHFDWLAAHPDLVNSQLQSTCMRLKRSWELMPENTCSKASSLLH